MRQSERGKEREGVRHCVCALVFWGMMEGYMCVYVGWDVVLIEVIMSNGNYT